VKSQRSLLGTALVGAVLVGCAGAPILPGLSTAASMEIEVDVYKGPLARTLTSQLMDSEGVLSGALDQLRSFLNENWGFYPKRLLLTNTHLANYRCQVHSGMKSAPPFATPDDRNKSEFDKSVQEASEQSANQLENMPARVKTRRASTLQLCYDTAQLVIELNKLKLPYDDVKTDIREIGDVAAAAWTAIEADAANRRAQCSGDSKTQCLENVAESVNTPPIRILRDIASESSEPQDYDSYAIWLRASNAGTTLASLVVSTDNERITLANNASRLAGRLRDLERVSARESLRLMRLMEEKAWYWNTNELARGKKDYGDLYAHFGQLVTDYANLIASRTDTVLKQNETGLRPEDLSTADHLRDVAPTAYLHLYDWLSTDRFVQQPAGRGQGPVFSSRGPDGLTARDRVRMAQRLFDDRYWTNINRVFASGRGEVRMAFVRDEIGNWNLKSFQSDPEKLLDAYRDAAIASVNLVTRVATAANPSKEFLKVADAFSTGSVENVRAVGKVTSQIGTARKDAQDRLAKVKVSFEARQADRQKTLDEATGNVATANTRLQAQEGTLAEQLKSLATNESDLTATRALDPQDPARIAALESQRTSILSQLNITRADLATATEKMQAATTAEQAARRAIREAGEAAIREASAEIDAYQRILNATATMASGSGQ
jgi:hypothetical protein